MADAQNYLPIIWASSADPNKFHEAVWGRVYNGRRFGRQPRAVVTATTVKHITGAVQLAAKQGCRLSIRSGGHSWAAWSVRDDAILLDLGSLNVLEYDDSTKTVACSPNITSDTLAKFLESKDRFFPVGHCPGVGMGGFTLQGGQGMNVRNLGYSAELLESADVVTADGKQIHCSEQENADLFWAARGAGHGFPSIVTKFVFRTLPSSKVYMSQYLWPVSEYRRVAAWFSEFATSPRGDSGTEIILASVQPPESPVRLVACMFFTFKPTSEEAEAVLHGVHEIRPSNPVVEVVCQPTDVVDAQALQALPKPYQLRLAVDSVWIDNGANVPAVIEKVMLNPPTPDSVAFWLPMYPASRRPTNSLMLATSVISDHYVALYIGWDKERDDAKNSTWLRENMSEIERHSVGTFLADTDVQTRPTKYWSVDAAQRLKGIRQKWDPTGVICGYLDAGDKSGVNGLSNSFPGSPQ